MKKNLFIAIEGVDGAGKATQTRLMIENLHSHKISAAQFSFPRYGTPGAQPIEALLRGEIGKPATVHPKIAAPLFFIDRLRARDQLQTAIESVDCVVSDRFSFSTLIHKTGRFFEHHPDLSAQNLEKKSLAEFADHPVIAERFDRRRQLEFDHGCLPEPDLVIFLSISEHSLRDNLARKSSERLATGTALDEAEKDFSHQLLSARVARELLPAKFPHRHRIDCDGEQGKLRHPDAIADQIREIIFPNFEK